MATSMIETEGAASGNKEDEDIYIPVDEDDIDSTDAETSSWESEPNTTRSSRQYHPIKGEQTILDVDDDREDEQLLFNGDYIPGNTDTGDQELLSSQYLRSTFGLDDAEKLDSHRIIHEILDSNEQTDEDPEFQRRSQVNEQAAGSSVDEAGDRFPEKDEQTDGDVIEELDLTKEPRSMFDGGPGGMPQAQFVFVPSLQFGGSSFDSLMMGLLSSDGDGVENDADVSSQSEAEGANQYQEQLQDLPKTTGGNEQERWEYLFGMLEQQHRQQVILQREHHERQVKLLKIQLARLTEEQEDLITKQHQEPLGPKSTPNNKEHEVITDDNSSDQEGSLSLKDSQKQPRRSPNGRETSKTQDRNAVLADHSSRDGSNEDSNSASEDTEGTLEGSIEGASETLMTTWSDVVEQKQAENEKEMMSNHEMGMLKTDFQENKVRESQADDDRFIALQKHFAKQQQQLEEQYSIQVRHMQQQWSGLQQQQQEQQEILRHLLSQQQERINQQHKERMSQDPLDPRDHDLNGAENRSSPTSDDTSMSCSDFTYWKQPEHDTYKALPDLSADDVTRDQGSPQPVNTQQLRDSSQQQRSPNVAGSRPSAAAQHTSLNPSGQRSPDLSGQSSSPRRSADDVDMGEDAQHTSSLRLNLREKHARHIADLKAYYEGEIKDLQSKLMEVASLQDHSPDKVLKRTNQKLQNNCIKLEAALKSANSRIEDLEDTVKALGARLDDTYNSTDSSMANLYQKVNDFKQLCRHKELDIQSLEKRNRELQTSLDQAYQLQDAQAMDEHRDQKLLKRVLSEYKGLAEKHEITKELLHNTETQLHESKAKICDLTRTLAHLELDVKRMDLDNSFSRRQNLPKSLSGTSLRSDTRLSTNAATMTPPDKDSKQDRNQTSQSDNDINKLLDSSGMESSYLKLSVEERKFLKPSTNYNVITGEEINTERGVEGLVSSSDTESISTQPEDDYKSAPGRPSNLAVPFDTDTDEERPLSPMMKAARQFDFWKAKESMNAGNSKGLLGNTPNGTHLADREEIQRPKSDYRNHSDNNSMHSQEHKISPSDGRLDIGPLTSDASIHIWPEPEPERKRSPVSTSSSNLGTALAHSSPKQLARQSLAKAMKPKDHDIFPVKGSKDTYHETGSWSPRTEARHSGDIPPSVHSRTGKESPRRQLFANEKKDYKPRGKDGVTSPSTGDNSADSVLAKVRSGDVQTRAEWENRTETGHDIIQRINHHQKKLDELMLEKRQLETTLSHVPISGRVSRQKQQEEERLEQRLENVTRELGSVRMLLRRYNALKSSI